MLFQIPDARKQVVAKNGHLHELTSDVKFKMMLSSSNTRLFKFKPSRSVDQLVHVKIGERKIFLSCVLKSK